MSSIWSVETCSDGKTALSSALVTKPFFLGLGEHLAHGSIHAIHQGLGAFLARLVRILLGLRLHCHLYTCSISCVSRPVEPPFKAETSPLLYGLVSVTRSRPRMIRVAVQVAALAFAIQRHFASSFEAQQSCIFRSRASPGLPSPLPGLEPSPSVPVSRSAAPSRRPSRAKAPPQRTIQFRRRKGKPHVGLCAQPGLPGSLQNPGRSNGSETPWSQDAAGRQRGL